MLRGVGAPRPPRLGAGEQLAALGRRPCLGHRAQQADVGGGERVGLAQSRASRCTARSTRRCRAARAACAIASSRLRRGPKKCGSASAARARATSAAARARGMPRLGGRDRASCVGPREDVGEPVRGAVRARQRLAVGGDQPSREAAPRRHRDLLAEHGAHRELEAVPGARHAQPGPRRDQRGEAGSSARCAPISAGSAARSNTRRRRATMRGSAVSSGNRIVARRRVAGGGLHRDGAVRAADGDGAR